MSIYSKERVIEILDSILSRTEDKQENKLKSEKTKDIIKKSEEILDKSDLMNELKAKLKENKKIM